MMSDLDRLLEAIRDYGVRYRRNDLPDLRIGDLYDLFPKSSRPPLVPCSLSWPQTWANSDDTGVYAFLDEQLRLLYIGTARVLGARLGAYCAYEVDDTCRLKHDGWTTKPRYVLTVAVPEEMPWEAAALEVYLIRTLDPRDNVRDRIAVLADGAPEGG